MRPLRILGLGGMLLYACTAPTPERSGDDGLRPVQGADLGALASGAAGAREELALAQATASSPDSRVLAACLVFPHADQTVLVVLYVTEISEDGQLALRGRYQVREAGSGAPFVYVQEDFEVEARPAAGMWSELLAGGRVVLEYRARP